MFLQKEEKFDRFDAIAAEIADIAEQDRRTMESNNLAYAICNGVVISERRQNTQGGQYE